MRAIASELKKNNFRKLKYYEGYKNLNIGYYKGWEEPKEKSLKYALNLIKKSGLNKTEAINILENVKERTQEILFILQNKNL